MTAPASDTGAARVVLADRKKTACYLLGPTLLTGHDLESATALVDDTTGTWIVNLHFANNDFVARVAIPHIGDQIAIIYRGVVESAPTINAGITGSDVTISGNLDQATARDLAHALS